MTSTLSVSKIQGLATAASPTTVEIASGHKISGNITHGSGSVFPAGHVVQAVGDISTVQLTTSSTSFVITDLSLNITPSSSSNKVLVHATCPVYAASGSHFIFTVYRNAINLGNTNWGCGASTNNEISSTSISILDTPNTTSEITYAIYVRAYSGTGYAMINSCMGSLTAQEITG